MLPMRLNLRSVPDEVIVQIDKQLAKANARDGTTLTRNQYIVAVLTDVFVTDNASLLHRVNDRMGDLTDVLREHLAAEQLLIYTVLNNALPEQEGVDSNAEEARPDH